MSLHTLAETLASKGRGGDSVLVHMSPGEVRGLQTLAMAHGGALTVNPETGLPEANFLKSILPMVAGAVLTGGMGIPALAAAAMVGGGTALATKNLGQGLMAGIGAFGGAGIGSALSGLGAAGAAGAGGGLGATTAAVPAAGAAGAETAELAANPAANLAGTSPTAASSMPLGAEETANLAAKAPPAAPQGMDAFKSGISRAIQNPDDFVKGLGGNDKAMRTGLMAAAPLLGGMGNQPAAAMPQTATPHPLITPYSYRYADGGIAALADNPYYTMSGISGDALSYLMGQRKTSPQLDAARAMPAYPTEVTGNKYEGLPQYKLDTGTGRFTLMNPEYAKEAETKVDTSAATAGSAYTAPTSEGAYAHGGRLLTGPGDGVSDSIPAAIDGKAPARLATGEFVFDARTVSEIGNGDTRAGAKKLYQVMNAIHRARTHAKRGEPSGADQHLRNLVE